MQLSQARVGTARAVGPTRRKEGACRFSDDTRRALRAYDLFTDFACCPDLPWSPDSYERLDDEVAQIMLHAFCYAWAASQQAAGVYSGSVSDLADELFDALPTWDAEWTHQRKVEWTLSLGLTTVLFQPDQRPPALPAELAGIPCAGARGGDPYGGILGSSAARRCSCSTSGARWANPRHICKPRWEETRSNMA